MQQYYHKPLKLANSVTWSIWNWEWGSFFVMPSRLRGCEGCSFAKMSFIYADLILAGWSWETAVPGLGKLSLKFQGEGRIFSLRLSCNITSNIVMKLTELFAATVPLVSCQRTCVQEKQITFLFPSAISIYMGLSTNWCKDPIETEVISGTTALTSTRTHLKSEGLSGLQHQNSARVQCSS